MSKHTTSAKSNTNYQTTEQIHQKRDKNQTTHKNKSTLSTIKKTSKIKNKPPKTPNPTPQNHNNNATTQPKSYPLKENTKPQTPPTTTHPKNTIHRPSQPSKHRKKLSVMSYNGSVELPTRPKQDHIYAGLIIRGTLEDLKKIKMLILTRTSAQIYSQHKDSRYLKSHIVNPTDQTETQPPTTTNHRNPT